MHKRTNQCALANNELIFIYFYFLRYVNKKYFIIIIYAYIKYMYVCMYENIYDTCGIRTRAGRAQQLSRLPP